MRNIKELLEILLYAVHQDQDFHGMCYTISRCLQFTQGEKRILTAYLELNRPWHVELLEKSYWWKEGNKRPRIKWLKKQIKKL
jgi:hypothetical protein